MNLVNWQGSAIFGPGSEWFWSMAQFVIVTVTLIGIYYQLRVARGANAFEQLNRLRDEGDSERMTRNILEIQLALRSGKKPEDVPTGAGSYVADYWESVAALVRAGHVDRKLIYEFLGNSCQWWWAALAPGTHRYRRETGDPLGGANFEWLAGIMADISRKAGAGKPYDEAYVASTLDRRIRNAQERLRAAEELRAVIVRPMPPAAPPQSRSEAAPVAPPA